MQGSVGSRQRRTRRLWLAVLGSALLFIYIPVIVVIVLSFNTSPFGTFPFEGTLRWYGELAANESLIEATLRSLGLAVSVSVTAAILGVSLAIWMVRFGHRLTVVLTGTLAVSVTVPWLILAISILLIAFALGSGRSMTALFLGSLVVALPYVVFVVFARLQGMGEELEHAARSLGAGPLTAFRLVTLPMLGKAVASGSMLAFIVTFNNFPIHFFLAPFGFNTLPMEVYTLVRSGYRPDINALATILVGTAVSVALLFVLWTRHRSGSDDAATEQITGLFGSTGT